MRTHTEFTSYNPETPSQKKGLELVREYGRAVNEHITQTGKPANSARMIILHGTPGCGKSHLLEAFAKSLGKHSTEIHWIHRSLCLDFPVMAPVFFSDKPIVIIDDLFQDENNPKDAEIKKFCELILMAYQRNMLLIVATNHPTETFLPRVMMHDNHGRVESRFMEMTRNKMNIIRIEGPDGRLAQTGML